MASSSALELSSSQYASRRKEMMTLLKQLRATGSQAELDLPRITVIGSQSAGKSSLVEAISGITVPRDAGTCTRCPMECRLSISGEWSCQISIRREYDASGNVLDKVQEIPFGNVITDKKSVELALRRAQVAVLNPHLDISEVLRASPDYLAGPRFVSSKSHKFSQDTVLIDIEGPDLTDLSFVDLPGLVENADPQVIKLVEGMVVSHIKGNCLILVALPMTDDIENQKALRLARQEDPDGRRTIGVMTKPDMLTAGQTKSRQIWLDIIEGRRHPLVHGYYCTRQPDDAQRAADITQEQARAAEALFFTVEAPWSKSTLKNRFGTVHLVASLSNLLIGIINEAIPRIRAEAASKLENCNHELMALPQAIDEDPANYMLKLITRFCDDVHRSVYDGLDSIQLVHHNRASFEELKTAVRKTAPNFIPVEEDSSGELNRPDKLTTNPPFYLNHMRQHIEKSITRELPNNTPFSAKLDLIAKFQVGWQSAVDECFGAVRDHVQRMLDYHIGNNFGRYSDLERHIQIFISEIVQKHIDSCRAVLQPVLKSEMTPFTQNGRYLSDSVAGWLAIYKGERDLKKASTQPQNNGFGPPSISSNAFGPPKEVPAAFRVPSIDPHSSATPSHQPSVSTNATEDTGRQVQINRVLAGLAALGYRGITEADFAKMIPSQDTYEREIQVMAEVRGYFQVAYKRIIDNIPALIDLLFVKALADDMQPSLITKLSLGSAGATERCSIYLAENPMVVVKRKELTARKKRLEEVRQALKVHGLSM